MIFPITDSYAFAVTLILSGIVGLCVGSFLNVVIYRVPLGMSVANPPSHCPQCNYQLKWFDNIPVLSYLTLGGKCRNCHCHISFRYTAVELLNTLLWVLSAFLFRENAVYIGLSMLALSVAVCVFFIDLEHMIIPDRFQIILLVLGILSIFVDADRTWYSHLIGCAAGFLVFLAVGWAVSRQVGTEALGGGDVKLAAVCGLFLGWEKFLLMMLISSVGAAVWMLARKSKKEREVPFAPFLTTGFAVALLFGEAVISAYLSLILL